MTRGEATARCTCFVSCNDTLQKLDASSRESTRFSDVLWDVEDGDPALAMMAAPYATRNLKSPELHVHLQGLHVDVNRWRHCQDR